MAYTIPHTDALGTLMLTKWLYYQTSVYRRYSTDISYPTFRHLCIGDTLPTSICASGIYSTDKHLWIGETLYRQVSVCRWDTLPTSVTRHSDICVSERHSTDKHLCIGEILSDILCLPTQRNISREIFLWALYKWDMIPLWDQLSHRLTSVILRNKG